MAESPGQYRLLSPLSRVETDLAGQPQRVRYAVGDVITPTEAELRAFGDRLVDVLAPPASPAPEGPRLNPELYELVQRAQAGEASADEQAIVGDVVAFMAHYARGVATPEETATLETVLTEFGMPLFV